MLTFFEVLSLYYIVVQLNKKTGVIIMSTMKSNEYVYYGPDDGGLYPQVGSVSSGETVTVIWREIANGYLWAHIEYNVTGTNQKKRGYVNASTVNITETVSNYTQSLQTRYIHTAGPTYLGPDDNNLYPEAGSVSYAEEVKWVCSIRENDFVYIEYDISGGKKKRAYIHGNSLGTSAPSLKPGRYLEGNIINSQGEKWHITGGWNNKGHVAIDVVRHNSSGTSVPDKEVYAIAAGTVVSKGTNSANGNYVIIKHTTAQNKTYYSLYFHLDSYYNKTSVAENEAIGIMGNTGSASRGTHLHLSITKNQPTGGCYGYYKVNDVNTPFNETGSGYFDYYNSANVFLNRFYNPTKYFELGESLINNAYN